MQKIPIYSLYSRKLSTNFGGFANILRKRDKILAFFLMILLAVAAGGVSCLLPVIVSPIVNYIGVPLVQLAIVVIIAVRSDKK